MSVDLVPDGDPDGSRSDIGLVNGHQGHGADMVVCRAGGRSWVQLSYCPGWPPKDDRLWLRVLDLA